MKFLFWLFLVLLLGTAYRRSEHFDDAWFAEEAYWLVHEGVVRSAFFRGLNGWEKQIFVFHKGFIYFGAALQGLFGFSLPVSKAVGACWALVGGWAIWWHLRWLRLAGRWVYLALLVYVANGMLIEYAFVNRPEPMYATLGFISFSLLVRGRTGLAAGLAGLAVITHLNGLCFVLAGVGWLRWNGRGVNPLGGPSVGSQWIRWRRPMCFGLVAGAVSTLYLTDAVVVHQLPTLWRQFRQDPATAHVATLADKLRITGSLHELLFHSEEEASLSALVLGITVLTFWPWQRTYAQPVRMAPEVVQTGRYLLLLLLAFALITKSNTDYYYLIFLPVMCVWVAQCVATWSAPETAPPLVHWRLYGRGLLLGVYLIAGAYKAVLTCQWNLSQPNVAEKNAHLASLIGQPGARIIAPLDFFYNQQGHYQIHGLSYYKLLSQQAHGDHMSLDQFVRLAEADSAVAVITDYGRDFSYPLKKEAPARLGRYERVYQDDLNALYLMRNKK